MFKKIVHSFSTSKDYYLYICLSAVSMAFYLHQSNNPSKLSTDIKPVFHIKPEPQNKIIINIDITKSINKNYNYVKQKKKS